MIVTISCNSHKNTPQSEEYYFDIDCVEDIIVYEDKNAFVHIVEYYNPDGLCIYNECTGELEPVQLILEEEDLFIDFMSDYNNFIDVQKEPYSSLTLGKKWYIIYEDNTYYLRIR